MTVPEEEATANYVPAAAVILRIVYCCPELLGVKGAQAGMQVGCLNYGLNP